MEQLMQRVRIKVGNFELEVEGASAYEEFHKLQGDGFGGLLARSATRASIPPTGASVLDVSATDPSSGLTELPSLSDLAIRDVAGSEREWIVIYGLYLTDRDGKKTFATADVWNLYKESGRDNRSRQGNLSSNMKRCVEVQWLTKIKDDTYALAPEGREHVGEVISRHASPKKSQRRPSKDAQDN